MSEIFSILSVALGLGFVGGVLPGPIMTAMFTQILQKGLTSAIRIPLTAGGIIAIIATFLFTLFRTFQPSEFFLNMLSAFGALLLVLIAWKVSKITKISTQEGEIFTFLTICGLTIANGSLWLSWLTIFLPQMIKLDTFLPAGGFLFLFVYLIAWLSGSFLMAFLFSRFRPWLTRPNIVPYVFKGFAGLLFFFAGGILWHAVPKILPFWPAFV